MATKQQLLDAIPQFVESVYPKNDTAEEGGAETPGRGAAAALLARFVVWAFENHVDVRDLPGHGMIVFRDGSSQLI